MFRGDIIIDGYNLLYAAGLSVPFAHRQALERRRQALLDVIAEALSERERVRTTIVFDAPLRIMGPSPPTFVQSLRVIFADGDGDADAAIERLIQENSAPRRLWVVSSDHRIQKAARRRRAKPLDSEEFLRRLARRAARPSGKRELEPEVKRSGRLSPGEVNAWLRVFEFEPPPVNSQSEPDPLLRSGEHQNPPVQPVAGETPTVEDRKSVPSENDDRRESLPGEEIAFWEARISELDREK